MAKKVVLFFLIMFIGFAMASDDAAEQRLRTFPKNTIFGTIQEVKYPEITIEEIPSNFGSKLLGMMLLKNQTIEMSPATLIRDKYNINQLQQYIDGMTKQAVAIQPDYQGKAWVIWQMTDREKQWVLDNKLNIWK